MCREADAASLDARFSTPTCRVRGAYMIAGLSGYGIMASMAAGEMVAAMATGSMSEWEGQDLSGLRAKTASLFDPMRY